MIRRKLQQGFTLAEMIIAMAVGFVVLAGVSSALVGSNQNNLDNLRMIRLNQELRTIMSLMSSDIRRAGYNGGAVALVGAGTTTASPFENITICTVATAGDCIMYSYDDSSSAATNNNGILDGNECYGFRLSGGIIQRRSTAPSGTPSTCPNSGWSALTDSSDTIITNLSFTLTDNEICNPAVLPSYSGSHVQTITISVTGKSARITDMDVTRTLTETVRTRNERYQYHAAGDCVNT